MTASSSSAGGVVLIIVLVAGGFALYWLPTFIAWRRNHHQMTAVVLVNALAGWTFVGWVVALVWSCMSPRTIVIAQQPPTYGFAQPPTYGLGPGWYRDPRSSDGMLRWWDGSRWTQATSRPPAP